ncbi:hypothetical protein RKE25_23380 (plasmid) [Dyella sp. BiH032]|uniref:hypothetical protein n=1 Tax=Dyella sp. BiH032 TaxID=3075430 RepID=UPI002892ACF5|nr:hypothetical protein [Dyella sp. BiH032]WNL48559.1 hypothetical protein RKE25_23380 [Dyella sp. BiH032]
MPRSTALPRIPVPTEKVTKKLAFDLPDAARIETFCEFYAQETAGAKPEFENAVIGLVLDTLDRNRAFVAFERAKAAEAKQKPAKKPAAPASKETPATADNG